ncbi:thymidylate kinase [Nomia melanderi]|uniref:thymidylate kinase n=1 Tax=Nomia melanderi TaxID=2448451 RepID=UPI0013040AB9|nr:thymidylate kinase [Nomia melanderi]
MTGGRGALIVFEGCDRAGKSTQVKMLIEALTKRNVPAECQAFPDRRTRIGALINEFLSNKDEFSPEAVHFLFTANRWELQKRMLRSLQDGTTLIVDRYAGSGAAYTASTTGRSLDWCKTPDQGLPRPDMVIYLKVSAKSQRIRSNWGEERFENAKIQETVASNYLTLMDNTWAIIDADQDKTVIHSQILEKVLDTIKKVKDLPIGDLYSS